MLIISVLLYKRRSQWSWQLSKPGLAAATRASISCSTSASIPSIFLNSKKSVEHSDLYPKQDQSNSCDS
ncbi:hypothetical protein SUGI_0659820 [Cryptomeria japonica]|nr:hypothetical protein SUGI_0659820 [Cryptomeria japonica]